MDRGTAYNIITGLATALITILLIFVGFLVFALMVATIQVIWSDFWALLT